MKKKICPRRDSAWAARPVYELGCLGTTPLTGICCTVTSSTLLLLLLLPPPPLAFTLLLASGHGEEEQVHFTSLNYRVSATDRSLMRPRPAIAAVC
jgi:hypothetical protein